MSTYHHHEVEQPRHNEGSERSNRVLQQITEHDRQGAYNRQDSHRMRDAQHPALPQLELFDHGRAVPEAVRQQMPDNYLMAGLAALASNPRGQQIIQNMVHPTDGSHFRVTFGNGESETVRAPQDMDFQQYAGNSGHGIWANVAERGYGQMIARHHGEDPARMGPWGATEVHSTRELMDTLIGPHGNRHEMPVQSLTEEALHQQLSQVGPRAFLMVAHSTSADMGGGGYPPQRPADAHVRGSNERVSTTQNWLYAVDHYDSNSRTVYLRNPAAINSRQPFGAVLSMSLHDFRRDFDSVSAVTP